MFAASSSTPEGYELSTEYLNAFQISVEKLGLLEVVPWSPAWLEISKQLSSGGWWPPGELEKFGLELLKHKDDAVIEQVGFNLVVPSIAPLFKLATRLHQNDPGAVFKQFITLSGDSIRGVELTFDRIGSRGGAFTVTYPRRDPPRCNGLLWKGTLRRICTAVPGAKLTEMRESPGAFRFALSW